MNFLKINKVLENYSFRVPFVKISISIFIIVGTSFFIFISSQSNFSGKVRSYIKNLILDELFVSFPVPAYSDVDAIYILGGTDKSLEKKFRVASEFLKKKSAKKLYMLSIVGVNKYIKDLGKYLTFDEWGCYQLKKSGIPEEIIDFVKIEKGNFGTLSEAMHFSEIAMNKGYEKILLISSEYHTKRVELSFRKFLDAEKITIYIHGAADKIRLRHAVIEFIKLKIYKYFILPFK